MTKTRSNIVFLEGKKVFLRPLLRRDIREEYLSWLNNPNLTQYSFRFRTWPTNEKELDDFLINQKTNNSVVFALECKKTGKHFGNTSIDDIDWINRRAHFNIMIGVPAYRGPHYIDTVRTVTAYAFNHLNLNKLTGASEIPDLELIHKKLGWKTEGIWKKHNYRNGKYVDIKLFAIFKDDFKKL